MNCVSCREPLKRLTSPAAVRGWKCPACHSVAAEIGSLSNAVPPIRIEAIEKAIK